MLFEKLASPSETILMSTNNKGFGKNYMIFYPPPPQKKSVFYAACLSRHIPLFKMKDIRVFRITSTIIQNTSDTFLLMNTNSIGLRAGKRTMQIPFLVYTFVRRMYTRFSNNIDDIIRSGFKHCNEFRKEFILNSLGRHLLNSKSTNRKECSFV